MLFTVVIQHVSRGINNFGLNPSFSIYQLCLIKLGIKWCLTSYFKIKWNDVGNASIDLGTQQTLLAAIIMWGPQQLQISKGYTMILILLFKPKSIYHKTDTNIRENTVLWEAEWRNRKKHELRNQVHGFEYWLLPAVILVQSWITNLC